MQNEECRMQNFGLLRSEIIRLHFAEISSDNPLKTRG